MRLWNPLTIAACGERGVLREWSGQTYCAIVSTVACGGCGWGWRTLMWKSFPFGSATCETNRKDTHMHVSSMFWRKQVFDAPKIHEGIICIIPNTRPTNCFKQMFNFFSQDVRKYFETYHGVVNECNVLREAKVGKTSSEIAHASRLGHLLRYRVGRC